MQANWLLLSVFCSLLANVFCAAANGSEERQQQQQLAASLVPQHRIVNGRDARIEDFPYQLSLRRSSVHICGAAVLNGMWAITAAHCVDGFERSPRLFTIRMGSTQRNTGGRVLPVAAIYKHPSFNPDSMNYDVALLRTQVNRMRGEFVAPIRLPKAAEPLGDNVAAVVSGWGHQSSSEHFLSNALKYTTVYTVNQAECNNNLRWHGGITDAMFCAAALRTDACQGDSGGPIQVNGVLVGIVSWGVGCADPNYPGVYTRLSYPPIRQWVKLISKL